MRKKDKEKIEIIKQTVSSYFGVSVDDAINGGREFDEKNARQFIKFFVKEQLGFGWSYIAKIIGGDHTTALYSHKLISDLIEIDAIYKEMYEDLTERLNFHFSYLTSTKRYYDLQRKIRRGQTRSYQRHRVAA